MIGRARHFWTDNDDNALVDILGELVARGAPKGFQVHRHAAMLKDKPFALFGRLDDIFRRHGQNIG